MPILDLDSEDSFYSAVDEVQRILPDFILPLPDKNVLQKFWSQEFKVLGTKFEDFLDSTYFINKMRFISVCINNGTKIYFVPPGCSKSVTCHYLKYFFDKSTSEMIKSKLTTLLKDVGCANELPHLGQYNVIHVDMKMFRTDDIYSCTTFSERLWLILSANILQSYPFLEIDKLPSSGNLEHFMIQAARMIKCKTGSKCVIIIDNVEIPVNWMISKSCKLNSEEKRKIAKQYLYVLHYLFADHQKGKNSYIFLSVMFGIHEMYGFRSLDIMKSDGCLNVENEEMAQHFLFTNSNLEQLLSSYPETSLNKEKLESLYGGLLGKFFTPSSVILSLHVFDNAHLFRSWRISSDIMINANGYLLTTLAYFLSPASANNVERPDWGGSYEQVLNNRSIAFAHFIRAGILTFEKLNNNTYRLKVPNYEIKNLIAGYLEREISIERHLSELDDIERALLNADAYLFETNINSLLESWSLNEFTRERDYHGVLHAFILCASGKKFHFSKSEQEGRGNRVTGKSGYYDLRFGSRDKTILYMCEIKLYKRKRGAKDESEDELKKIISKIKESAFTQIITRGYSSIKDVQKYKKVVHMAIVGHNKRIFVSVQESSNIILAQGV